MELARSTSRGGFSVRSIFTFVLTVVVAALLWAILVSPVTHAADEPIGKWSGETIMYDGHQYYPAAEAKTGESHGLAQGTHYYVHVEEVSERPLVRKAHVIYFAPGLSPPTATSASYAVYDFSTTKIYSNPQDKKSITTTPQNEESLYPTSCSVDGIGWIICPVTVFLASAMDWIFEVVAGLVEVQPLATGGVDNDLYTAWNVMRSIANVAFIIVFIIIIYSQLTSVGLTNYGLKKLLPRLIIGAILVNLSYYICAIAVDISNVFGYSLQDILIQIRQSTFNIDGDTWSSDTMNWSTISAIVLSGGAAIGGVVALSTATVGEVGGLVYMIVPLLVGLLLTIFFVLLILAARQAIIIILIVIAPLAFVAYLLPNTEKWFEKWRDLFVTMLVFFPAFSLVFGGSQLAGGIILQNANSLIMMVFGLAVQVAPLVITPLLLKLSGGLLGKIAGLVNDPRKGLLDRTRNWSKDRAEMLRQEGLGKKPGINPFRRIGQAMDNGNRNVKKRTEIGTARADNRYNSTSRYGRLHEQEFMAAQDHEIIENRLKTHIQDKINVPNSRLNLQNARLEVGKSALEKAVQVTAGDIEEYKAGKAPASANAELQAAIRRLSSNREALSVEKMRTDAAQSQQQRDLATALKGSVGLRTRAGGIKPLGAESVLASAITAVQKADAEDIKNIQDAADIRPGDLNEMARQMAEAIRNNQDIQARAFQNMLLSSGGGGIAKFRDAITDIDSSFTIPQDLQDKLRDNILSNHPGVKPKAKDIDNWAVKGGKMVDQSSNAAMWANLNDEDIVTLHTSSIELIADTRAISRARAQAILNNSDLNTKLTPEDKAHLQRIR